jgi:hypothetical protein
MMLRKISFGEDDAALLSRSSSGDAHLYFQTICQREFTEPEKRLMLAVLEDALRCREKYLNAKDEQGKRLFREAEEWLMSETEDCVFSFGHVCDVLGCNPSYLRKLRCGRRHGVSRTDLLAMESNSSSTNRIGDCSAKPAFEGGKGKVPVKRNSHRKEDLRAKTDRAGIGP